MATWFSHPIAWDASMTLTTDSENAMKVTRDPGPIDITALYDGMVIYRTTSTSPEKANLEFVLMPDRWPDDIQKFFNPDYKKLAHFSRLTELPPGRVVYRDIPKDTIRKGLHKLILDKFTIYRGDHSKVHRVLTFVDRNRVPKSLTQLKDRLMDAWNSTPDDGERRKRVDAEIDQNLDVVFSLSVTDTLLHGLPVEGADLLCTVGDSTAPAEVTFEIRNLYGEPLNPHFYLKNIAGTSVDLTPVPPFPAGDLPAPRLKATDQPLFVRIPKMGGVEFDYAVKAGRRDPYKSALIWTHSFDAGTGSHATTLEPRPGVTVDVPSLDTFQQARVNKIWNTDYFHINKHAEIFQVPCELILSTMCRESNPLADNSADLHSVHLENIEPTGKYPVDYENLLAQTTVVGSVLTKDTIDAYFGEVGEWATATKGLAFPPRHHTVAATSYPRVKPANPFQPSAAIGSTRLLMKITWAQLAEIVQVKPDLIAPVSMALPALGKTRPGQYHYDLVANAPGLGAEVARIYWTKAGGVRLNAGKEELSTASMSVDDYPLPSNKNWTALSDPADPTKVVRWEQLLALLKLLSTNGVKVPEATYILQPLKSLGDYSYSTLFARPQLMALLHISAGEADDVMARYFTLMTKGLEFVSNAGPAPGVEGVQNKETPSEEQYLSLPELRALSQIYPNKISIGLGQILIETARRLVLTWVKTHYGSSFFKDVIGTDPPPDSVDARIPWLWDNLWDNEELQIALIAAYHKQNATTFWQTFTEPEDNGGNTYQCGDMMTRFDFPRVGGAYNGGYVRKAFTPASENPDSNWGLHTYDKYFVPVWSAITYAQTLFINSSGTPKEASVRLRPDLETDSGMDPR